MGLFFEFVPQRTPSDKELKERTVHLALFLGSSQEGKIVHIPSRWNKRQINITPYHPVARALSTWIVSFD